MQENKSKYNGRFEINDLIGDAVKNATARRNQAIDPEDALSALSDEQAGSIAGGSIVEKIIHLGGYLLGQNN